MKLYLILGCLLVLWSSPGEGARLEIGEVVAGPRATAVVPVRLVTDGAAISSLQFELQYPKNILMVSVVQGAAARESQKQLFFYEPEAGTKRILLVGMNQTPIPDGAILLLHTSSPGPLSAGAYRLLLANAVAANAAGASVGIEIAGGEVRVDPELPEASLLAAGVLNSASFLPGPVTPGALITLLGARLGMADQVLFDGIPAQILFAAGNQINTLVPSEVSGPQTKIELLRESLRIAEITVAVTTAAPGIFTEDASGGGPAILTLEDGTRASAGNAARAGSVVTVYVTGLGSIRTLTARIGDLEAAVTGVDALEGTPGILQVHIRIPEGVSGLALPLVVSTLPDSIQSQAGVTIAVSR